VSTPKTDAACGWPWGHHGRIESSDLKCSPDGPFVHSSVARELERENAALRSLLQDSLEWLDDYGMRMSGTNNLVGRIETALRKEAQP
jgi:hypothetical protein